MNSKVHYRVGVIISVFAVLITSASCLRQKKSGFVMAGADPVVSSTSRYPVAVEPARVGTYSAETESGAGYFYDDVLEYRVWLHPEEGARALNGDDDYFLAFAQYERAEAFHQKEAGSEEPLVLIRQREWIDEPQPGQYRPDHGERIAEWKIKWLPNSKRTTTSIRDFLAHPKPADE